MSLPPWFAISLVAWCVALSFLQAQVRAQRPVEEWLRGPSSVPAPQRIEPALGDAREKDDADDKEDEKEPELPPGLLGHRFHGRGGVKAEYIYTGEVFTNARGGLDTNDATKYRGLFSLALTADLEQLDFFPGGKFFLLGENAHGRGLTESYIGDFQWLSNIDGRQFSQVSEYWWERSFWNESITIRLGKQDCNTEFAVVDLGGDFIHSSYGFQPTIPMPSWPDGSMAAVALFKIRDGLFLKAGVWDGAPYGGTWGFSGAGVTFSIYELEAEYKLGGGRLPGDCHIGMWYHSDQFDDVTPLGNLGNLYDFRSRKSSSPSLASGPLGAAGDTYRGNHGVYFGWEQLVFAEPLAGSGKEEAASDEEQPPEEDPEPEEHEDPQGLGLFCQYGWAPKDRNLAHQYFGSGVVYRGLLPGRDEDFLGLGVAHVIFSDLLPDQTSETAVELFYKAQLSPWVVVQPDLQYLARPDGQHRDAFAVGLRFELML